MLTEFKSTIQIIQQKIAKIKVAISYDANNLSKIHDEPEKTVTKENKNNNNPSGLKKIGD